MTVTIREVAKRLGLSIATVSRALDDYPDIALKTRQRVQQTAAEMGYTPNRAARQLRRRKADVLGYILPAGTPSFTDPFYAAFLVGLSDETALQPYDLLVSIAAPGQNAEQQIYRNWTQSRKVDGFILNRMRRNDWRALFLRDQGVPLATLENGLEGADYPWVEVDHQAGMLALVKHLAQRGFRKLVFIGGPEELIVHVRRLQGFLAALEQVGLPLRPDGLLPGDLTSQSGYQAVKRMRWIPDPPDAIVCVNDETALGALYAAHELGLQVGEKLAITGFDGVQATQYTDPPLTTLSISPYHIARQLVRLLVAELQAAPLPEHHIVVQPDLLIRPSTQGGASP